MLLVRAYVFMSFILLGGGACTRGAVFNGGDNERKPPSPASRGGDQQKSITEQDIPVANASYYMTVVAASKGTLLCEGLVHFTFSSGFSLNPTGTLECKVSPDRDMNKMLGNPVGPFLEDNMENYAQYGHILRRPNPANAANGPTFTPPRPDRIGPVIQKPEDFLIFKKPTPFTEPTHVSYTNKKGELIEDDGVWTLEVHQIHSVVVPDGYRGPEVFDDVIHWEISMNGLNKGPKGEINAFDSMTYYYNVKPIRVPKIVIKSKLKDVMPGALSAVGDLFLGGIIIEMNLREWKEIPSAALQ